jgi:hypothetical protein
MLKNALHIFLWGAHAPSRADVGALAEIFSEIVKVRDREGAIASTRGACAPQKI